MHKLLVLLFCLFAVSLNAQTAPPQNQCQSAKIVWRDAVMFSKLDTFDINADHTMAATAFGCVTVKPDEVLIFGNFYGTTPDSVLVIPKDWVISVVYFEEKKDDKPAAAPKPSSVPGLPVASAPNPLRAGQSAAHTGCPSEVGK